MSPDAPLSRGPSEDGTPPNPDEGVRIIKADEVADAVERGDAVRRKRDEPKFGDRPEPPEVDAEPVLRFPLADSADAAGIDRPRVAPIEPRTVEDLAAQPAPPTPPVLFVEPVTGETELPHWTEPATGEVPRVIIGEGDDDADADEVARWSSFASSGPRWRDEHDDWDHDVTAGLTDAEQVESVEALGALDRTERPTAEEFLTFDDLEIPEAPAPIKRPPRGSSADPIRIRSAENRPAAPTPPASAAPPSRRTRRPARPAPETGGSGAEAEATPAEGRGGGRDVPQAVFVGVAIAVVALILFKLGPAFAMVAVVVVVALAGVEFFGAVQRGGYRPATLLGLVAVAAFPLAAHWRGESAIALVLFVSFVFTVLWFLLGVGGSARPVPNIAITMLGVLYVGLLGSYAALILKVPSQGVSLLLVTVAAAVFYDVGGFFVGRRFGRTPLTSVSPNKTVEGLLGGMAGSILAAVLFAKGFGVGGFSFGQAVIFGVFVAIAAPLGDLAESLFKRDLGVKDMGSLIPQHGGVLDRFDSMLFVLPTAFYVTRVLGLA